MPSASGFEFPLLAKRRAHHFLCATGLMADESYFLMVLPDTGPVRRRCFYLVSVLRSAYHRSSVSISTRAPVLLGCMTASGRSLVAVTSTGLVVPGESRDVYSGFNTIHQKENAGSRWAPTRPTTRASDRTRRTGGARLMSELRLVDANFSSLALIIYGHNLPPPHGCARIIDPVYNL